MGTVIIDHEEQEVAGKAYAETLFKSYNGVTSDIMAVTFRLPDGTFKSAFTKRLGDLKFTELVAAEEEESG